MTFTIIDFKAKMTVGGFNPAETISFIGYIVHNDNDYNIGIVSEDDCAEYPVNNETDFYDLLDWMSLYE
jgi:hypothetical protein